MGRDQWPPTSITIDEGTIWRHSSILDHSQHEVSRTTRWTRLREHWKSDDQGPQRLKSQCHRPDTQVKKLRHWASTSSVISMARRRWRSDNMSMCKTWSIASWTRYKRSLNWRRVNPKEMNPWFACSWTVTCHEAWGRSSHPTWRWHERGPGRYPRIRS